MNGEGPSERDGPSAWAAAYALVFAGLLPVLAGLPEWLARDALLPADAQAHAAVAQALARGLPHGWVDVYAAGFPFGPHYQSVALVVVASLAKLGLPVVLATQAAGVLGSLAIPPLLLACLRASGARAAPAAAGVLLATWASPAYPLEGILDAYLVQGLLSQVVGTVLLLATARALLEPRLAWLVPPLAALTVAAHTQLSVLSLVVAAPVILVAGDRALARRFALGAIAGTLAGAALYGLGARTMHVPFSWSKGSVQAIAAFPIEPPIDWLVDGVLLDANRVPFATVTVVVALVGLGLARATARARVAALLLALLVLLAVSGRVVAGTRLAPVLELVSPLRAAALLSIASGVAAAEGLAAWLVTAERAAASRVAHVRLAAFGVALAVGTAGFATRAAWLGQRLAAESDLRGERACGPRTPPGYRTDEVERMVAGLARGRLIVDVPSFAMAPGQVLGCPGLHGLDVASPVPLGAPIGGPGTQLGVMQEAFESLRPTDPGADRRAESLGARAVLHVRARRPTGDFAVRASHGDVELSERTSGTDFVGAGCVVRRWCAPDRALRDRLFDALGAPGGPLDDPRALVELATRPGPFVDEPAIDPACDASTTRVDETAREPGAYEAWVDGPTPVDVVVRATAWPGWSLAVDGAPVTPRTVAPGYPSVRVPAGRHHVVAVAALPPSYLAGVALAAALVAALSVVAARRGSAVA